MAYANRGEFCEKVAKRIWRSTHSLKAVAEHFNITTSAVSYNLKENNISLHKNCRVCDTTFNVSGVNKTRNLNSVTCSRKCQIKYKRNLHKYNPLAKVHKPKKVWPKEKVCRTCNKEFKVSTIDSHNLPSPHKKDCSDECYLEHRRKTNATKYAKRRKQYNKEWYEKKGKEYGEKWRKKHRDKINSRQRKSRTGRYGYRYETRREAIKKGYRSAYEQTIIEGLLSQGLDNFGYETEVIPWVDFKEHKYTPDLVFEKKSGGTMYVELKGYLDQKTRSKMLNVKKSNPELDIRFCFQSPGTKISKKSKTTYEQWAIKNGFPSCGPTISQEWLDETV